MDWNCCPAVENKMQQLFTVFSCQGLFFGKLKKNGESVNVLILAGDPRHCQVLWYLWLLVGGGDAVCIHMSTYARLPCLRCLCDRAVLFPFNHHPTSNWQLSQQKLFWGRHQHFITITANSQRHPEWGISLTSRVNQKENVWVIRQTMVRWEVSYPLLKLS